jgi:ring-1,2-phenylacetyl-CoA epoxidase subunit PaaC
MSDHDLHDNAYAELLGSDDSQWAFGGGFEDPLAGIDTSVPDGLDPRRLAEECLRLGDDALVLSHRLSEWCSNAPDLEDDIALANTALDLLGQARLLLARAAAADPDVVPPLPAGSPVPPEDALAYFRDAAAFRCSRLVELPNGDFAQTVARLLLCATARHAELERLRDHPDPVLAAIASKGVPEVAYHCQYAARWFVTLALGTEESRRRLEAGLVTVWPYRGAVEPAFDEVLAAAELEEPAAGRASGTGHTEALSRLLAELQSVARAHPRGLW